MESKVTIKNFRAFDENGVMVDLKPITILTGCNSAGKSSMTKAVSLLNSFLSQIKKALYNGEQIDLTKYRLDFTTYPNSLLGNFNQVVHEGSTIHDVTFEYTVYSRMLATDVTVQLVFANDDNDKLNNGWLKRMSMSTAEGQFFSTDRDKDNDNSINFNIIKDAGFDFLIVEYLVHCYCGLIGAYECEQSITKEEFDQQKAYIEKELNKCSDAYKKDVCAYVRTAYNEKPIIVRCSANPKIVSWSKRNGSLFMIPIIEDLNKIEKEKVKKWISNNIQFASAPKGLESYTNIVIDDFVASDYTCFGDYFKYYENQFLKEARYYDIFSITKMSSLIRDSFSWDGSHTLFDKVKEVGFFSLYDCVMQWNSQLHEQEKDYYIDTLNRYSHIMFSRLLHTFVEDLILEVLTTEVVDNMEYASSSRAKIQRLYTLDVDDDFTRLLKNYFEKERESRERVMKYEPFAFLNKWISKIGIGNKIEMEQVGEGLGFTIRLYKTEDDQKGHLLAEEGYGITQMFAVLLQIETAILSAKGKRNNYYGLNDLDGQSDSSCCEANTILIEEPEIHLHPKYQSLLADMMVDAYQNYNIHFIVETHSEYLIRKLQVLVAENKVDLNKISLNYFDDPDAEKRGPYTPQLKKIDILPDGRLADKFGVGFFDEADRLAFNRLTASTTGNGTEKENSVL